MGFDAQRYRREVLEPARDAGMRPTDDLLVRYQLREPLTADQVRQAVAAVTAFWQQQRAGLAFKTVITALETDHRRLRPLFDEAVGGNLLPLTTEIRKRRAEQESRTAELAEQFKDLASQLGLVRPESVQHAVADGHDKAAVEALLRRLKIVVSEPDALPVEPPVRGYGQLRQNLTTVGCRHIADLLIGKEALHGGFTVLDRFGVTGKPALRMDTARVAAVGDEWAKRLDGKSVVDRVLTVLRRLSADQLRELLRYECADEIRTQRDLGLTTQMMLKKARGLGLADADATRLVFAVRCERVSHRSVLASHLDGLLASGEVLAAERLVGVRAGEELPEDARELAEQVRQRATRARALREQAQAAGDHDAAYRLLDEAVANAPDLPDVDALRRDWPPHPPGTPSVVVEGASVQVSWVPSPTRAGEVRYRVVRTAGSAGAGTGVDHVVGELVGETSDTVARDERPPVNVALRYSVVALRAGAAATPSTSAAVWVRPEVADLEVTAHDGVVSAAWQAPPGVVGVQVRRAEGRPPRGADHGGDGGDGGVGIPASISGFTDRTVRNGRTYHYLVSVVYPEPDGGAATTPGLRVTATPDSPPEPVQDLRFDPVPGDPESLLVGFADPAAGTVQLRAMADQAVPDAGTLLRLAGAALPGRPVAGTAVPGGLRIRAPKAPTVLLALTVSGDLAVVGAHREWVRVPELTDLRAERRGSDVLVTWRWPAGVAVVDLRWRCAGGPWLTQMVSVNRYRVSGGARIAPPAGEPVELEVSPVLRTADRQLTGAGQRVRVETLVAGRYTVRLAGPPWQRRVRAVVTADRSIRVPRLVLLWRAGRVMPLVVTDGDVLAEADDVWLGPDTPYTLNARTPHHSGAYWLRCLAPGGAVDLHDPPRDQLRVER